MSVLSKIQASPAVSLYLRGGGVDTTLRYERALPQRIPEG